MTNPERPALPKPSSWEASAESSSCAGRRALSFITALYNVCVCVRDVSKADGMSPALQYVAPQPALNEEGLLPWSHQISSLPTTSPAVCREITEPCLMIAPSCIQRSSDPRISSYTREGWWNSTMGMSLFLAQASTVPRNHNDWLDEERCGLH